MGLEGLLPLKGHELSQDGSFGSGSEQLKIVPLSDAETIVHVAFTLRFEILIKLEVGRSPDLFWHGTSTYEWVLMIETLRDSGPWKRIPADKQRERAVRFDSESG